MRPLLAAAAIALVAGGCAKKSPTLSPAMAPAREGQSTFRVLSEPAATARTDDTEVSIVPVAPGLENRLPAYPAEGLVAGCGRGAVATRVYIGPLGRVVKQLPVPDRGVPADSCHASFGRAVAETVERWGFFPALRRTCVTREGAPPRCGSVPIETYVDLEFLFQVVDGQPDVRPR